MTKLHPKQLRMIHYGVCKQSKRRGRTVKLENRILTTSRVQIFSMARPKPKVFTILKPVRMISMSASKWLNKFVNRIFHFNRLINSRQRVLTCTKTRTSSHPNKFNRRSLRFCRKLKMWMWSLGVMKETTIWISMRGLVRIHTSLVSEVCSWLWSRRPTILKFVMI